LGVLHDRPSFEDRAELSWCMTPLRAHQLSELKSSTPSRRFSNA
jgi:hypothetical protein